MAAPAVQPASMPQPAALEKQQDVAAMCQQPACHLDGGAATSRKRKCGGSPLDVLQSAASLLELDSIGSRQSADSECFHLDLGTFTQEASPESQQLSFRPHTPGNAGLGKRRRLSLGAATSGSASLCSAASCGPTPPQAAGPLDDASPASAHLLRVPSVPPPLAAVAPCGDAACGSCQLLDAGDATMPDCDEAATAPLQRQPDEQEALQRQVAVQQAHHQQLLLQQQQQQQQQQAAVVYSSAARLSAAQHVAGGAVALRPSALSRCATMPPMYRQVQPQLLLQQQPRMPPSQQQQQPSIALGIPVSHQRPLLSGAWAPTSALPTLTRLRRSTSDNSNAASLAHLQLPTYPLPIPQHGVQPFSELLAAAELRRSIPQQQAPLQQNSFQNSFLLLRHSHSAGLARRLSASHLPPLQPGQALPTAAAASTPPQPFAFAAAGPTLQTRSAHAAFGQQDVARRAVAMWPAAAAPLFSLRARAAQQPSVPQPALQQSATQPALQQNAAKPGLPPAPAAAAKAQDPQRRWPPVGAPGGAGGAPQLLARWGRALSLRRGETLLLALHMWERLQPKVKPEVLLKAGAPQPWQAALLGCLWVAAKLEERRRGLPSASKVGELLGLNRRVVTAVELHVMEALEWAPTAGWQSRRREFRA